jgi:hypothetical protein
MPRALPSSAYVIRRVAGVMSSMMSPSPGRGVVIPDDGGKSSGVRLGYTVAGFAETSMSYRHALPPIVSNALSAPVPRECGDPPEIAPNIAPDAGIEGVKPDFGHETASWGALSRVMAQRRPRANGHPRSGG